MSLRAGRMSSPWQPPFPAAHQFSPSTQSEKVPTSKSRRNDDSDDQDEEEEEEVSCADSSESDGYPGAPGKSS